MADEEPDRTCEVRRATAKAGAAERVSVVVLTYQRPRLLRRCLESLLCQTYPREALEIVVSDDGSEDDTALVVAELAARDARVRHVRQPHRGIPAARNNGLRHATGSIVAFVADDYVLRPDYVDTAVRFLETNPQALVVRFRIVPAEDHFGARVSHCFYDVSVRKRLLLGEGTAREAGLRGLLRRIAALPEAPDGPTTDHALEAAGAAAFRRAVFDTVGGFDERLLRTEDSDFTLRLRRAGIAVHYLPSHAVKHHYERWPVDTLRKCYLTGVHRHRLVRKHTSGGSRARRLVRVVRAKAHGLLDAVVRARQGGSLGRFVAYLPVMLLFEAADTAGYLAAAVGLHRGDG